MARATFWFLLSLGFFLNIVTSLRLWNLLDRSFLVLNWLLNRYLLLLNRGFLLNRLFDDFLRGCRLCLWLLFNRLLLAVSYLVLLLVFLGHSPPK